MGDFLSKDEIDALLRALSGGFDDAPPAKNFKSNKSKKDRQFVKATECDDCPKKKTCKGNLAICPYR